MNEHQFIEREIDLWGEDAVFDLIDKGFRPVLTNKGWRWIHDVSPLTQVSESDMLSQVS